MIRKFLENEQGNISIMFAGSIIVICGVVGVSVDYARILNDKQKAQQVLDASLLTAATEFQKSGKKRAAKELGKTHMTSSLPDIDKSKIKINFETNYLTGTFEDKTDHTFLSVFANPTTNWAVESRIKFSRRAITDFALAIDVSNSMVESGLIAGLRTSLENFSKQAFLNANDGDVSVSVIPFANTVSFEQDYDRWLDRQDGYSQTTTFNGCFEYEPISNRNLLSTTNYSNRVAAFDRRRAPNAENVPFCPEESSNAEFYFDNERDLSSKVSNLTTAQGTNTADGLTWAWRALSPQWRNIFQESTKYPRAVSETNNKVIILLTDGRPFALPSVKEEMDRDLARANALEEFNNVCRQIDAENNIDLYTIVYGNLMTQSQRKAIRKCIAGNGRSFWGGNENQLSSIFTRIVSMNSDLALAR